MTEVDPAQTIVNAETFSYFVMGYVTDAKESAPEIADKIRTVKTEFIRGILPDVESTMSPQVKLVGVPWPKIPENIQKILNQQYEAEKIPEPDKAVSVAFETLGRSDIGFTIPSLHNRSISGKTGFYDIFGETFIGNGAILRLSKYGPLWLIAKAPPSIAIQFSVDIPEKQRETGLPYDNLENSLILEAQLTVSKKPATLQELKDVASLMHKSRNHIRLE